jgi:3-deoxy-D-manno-octulosonic-acid transferase
MGKRGGQNMIEPAAYGVPVCFGPNTWNFRDVVQLLLDQHAAQVVCSSEELFDFVRASIEQPQLAQQMGLRGQQLVVQQRGAVERTVAMLVKILSTEKSLESSSDSEQSAAA